MHNNVRNTVRSFLREHHCTNSTVVVAVSGGVDSVTLLDVIHAVSDPLGLTVVVAHANHGLRGIEADDDQRLVISISEMYGFECITDSLNVSGYAQSSGLGIEAAARTLRYQFLSAVAIAKKATHVIVGHHADDAAETLLSHLARGSGLDGLASHRPVRMLSGRIQLLRPLLSIQRNTIVEYARNRGLRWREDSSNSELYFLRNAIRHEVMPVMRKVFGADVSRRLARTAELLRSSSTIVQTSIARHHSLVTFDEDQSVCIALAPLQSLLPAEQLELLRYALHCKTNEPANYVDTMRLVSLVNADVGSRATLSGHVIAWKERTAVRITSTNTPEFHPIALKNTGTYVACDMQLDVNTINAEDVEVVADPNVAYIDADSVEGALVWRVWQDGERLVPFGMQQPVLVSDIINDAHIPSSKRRTTRVVADEVGILWVCGIRQAERTRITAFTRQILTLQLR